MSDLASDNGGGLRVDIGEGTERPLSDYERALIQRLLSDPFVFPIQFKTWLISFLEGGDITLPKSSVQGLTAALGTGGGAGILGVLPAGLILPYGGAAAPQGALLCNGAQYSTTGYKRLFDAIGYAYGGSGALFAVPDLRKRAPFGQGAGFAVGGSDGLAEASRSPDHSHDINQSTNAVGNHSHGGATAGVGDHSHTPPTDLFAATAGGTAPFGTGAPTSNRYLITNYMGSTNPAGAHSHGISGDGGHSHTLSGPTSGPAQKNHGSYLTVGFIINY
jgi:microcystin-dependent protein